MADDLYYPDLSGDEATKVWVNTVREAIRILFDSIYELGGRKGQTATFANQIRLDGDLTVSKKGGGLQISESGDLGATTGVSRSEATMGVVRLNAGLAVVTSTQIRYESRVFLTPQDGTGTGALSISARKPGETFTISSSDVADARAIAWLIVQPHGAVDTAAQVPTTESQTNQKTDPVERPNRKDPEWVREYNRTHTVMLP